MSDAETPPGTATVPAEVDQSGRELGPRALQTRTRLMEATRALLTERSVRDISVVEIARRAETSPATFYQYFKDVGEVTLRLADDAAKEIPKVIELIDGDWEGEAGLQTAIAITTAFTEYWEEHRAVLLVRNLAADEGDQRFMDVRGKVVSPIIARFTEKITASQQAGRVPADVHPQAAAVAMTTILERLAAYQRELEAFGVTRKDIIASTARILFQTVPGK